MLTDPNPTPAHTRNSIRPYALFVIYSLSVRPLKKQPARGGVLIQSNQNYNLYHIFLFLQHNDVRYEPLYSGEYTAARERSGCRQQTSIAFLKAPEISVWPIPFKDLGIQPRVAPDGRTDINSVVEMRKEKDY